LASSSFGSEPLLDALPDANATEPFFPLSVMLWTVRRELPFDQRLEIVAAAGYHACELVGEFKDWSKEDYARFRKQRESLGIVFDATSGISSSLCDPAQRDALLTEIQAHLVRMEELQCSKLILLSGNRVEGLSHAQLHANCVEAIKAAADLAATKNVELLIENIDPEENPKYFLTSVAEGFDVVRETGRPNVKFLYDFFHEQIAEGNLIEKLEKNIDIVGLVHIADVPGRHEPGTGEINYPNIFRKLRELNYRRYAAMEFIPTGDTVAALRAARELATNASTSAAASSCNGGSSDPCISAANRGARSRAQQL
jgi:hydroxypyruvate isomerase